MKAKKTIRKVLVINSGSSSLKYQLFDMTKGERLAKGLVERIGCGGPKDHTAALKSVVEALGCPKDIDAIGHRVLHGGEVFKDSVLMTKANMKKCKALVKFGPLHMPANLGGIEACEKIFKGVPNVAVFDTAFHQTMPDCAAMYAIDPKYYKKMGIRKYGFHGTSHKFIVEEAAKFLKKPVSKVNLVTCHMGNGSSLAAVKEGKCVDTSMGLTPLAGMVMGTRCGDIDAAAVLSIMEAEKLTPAEADTLLNKKSGLLALTGSSDCRDICSKAEKGDKAAELALEMLAYRTALYIGGYNTIIGGADAIIMTGGIGENSSEVRERIINRLGALGIKLDKRANKKSHGVTAVLSAKGSKIPVIAIPTNEELMIARDCVRVLGK
ncbi:MAG: acetate kinase [Lentisphaerae bacterium]|jgi:acetate kinase|nr:acetate kinase [Lentisphaerota bacterium]